MSLVETADRHAALLDVSGLPRPETDLFYVLGQSNAAGTTPSPATVSIAAPANAAAGILRAPQPDRTISRPFRNGSPNTPHFGASAPWPWFADRWYSLTWRMSYWCALAVGGQCLVPASVPDVAQHWSPADLTKCLAADFTYAAGGETQTRRALIHDAVTTRRLNPAGVPGKRIVVWCQGEQDAVAGIANNRIRGADYQAHLNMLFDFMRSAYMIDHFLIFALGRRGTDPESISSNENNHGPIREAQLSVAASRADTYLVLDAARETGTLTVDEQGYHVSGWDYQDDGVHYTSESYRAMGLTGAVNAATALELYFPPI